MRLLALDIGGTMGWATIDTETDRILEYGQCSYYAPGDDPGKRQVPTPPWDVVVIEEPSGILFKGSKSNVKDLITHAMRTARWQGYFEGQGRKVYMVKDNRSKGDRVIAVCLHTHSKAIGWREHEADAAAIGIEWSENQHSHGVKV